MGLDLTRPRPRCGVSEGLAAVFGDGCGRGGEAVLIAKTFTAAAAIVIFHRAGASLIRMISGGGDRVVKGTCLTSFSQKLSHKDFPLLFCTKTEPFSIPQICLLSTHPRRTDYFS